MAPNYQTTSNPTKRGGQKRKDVDQTDSSNLHKGSHKRKRSSSFMNTTRQENARGKYNTREIFVGNLSQDLQDVMLVEFFCRTLEYMGLIAPAKDIPVCVMVSRSKKKRFAFLEFFSEKAATASLVLDNCPLFRNLLKVERPALYHGPPVEMVIGWDLVVANCSTSFQPRPVPLKHYLDATDRDMQVTGFPKRFSSTEMEKYLGSSMEMLGLSEGDGSPVVSCKLNDKDGVFRLRSRHEATSALCLNGIPCMGYRLRISRSNQWKGPRDDDCYCWSKSLAQLGAQPLLSASPGTVPCGSVQEKLCISNLNRHVTGMAELLSEFLQNTLACIGSQNLDHEGASTVYNCDVEVSGSEGTSAIVTFSSPAAATEALMLHKAPFMGTRLSIKRPASYIGPKDLSIDWELLRTNRRFECNLDPTAWNSSCEQDVMSRELYVGKVSAYATNSNLKIFLGSALEQLGLAEVLGSPIADCSALGESSFIVTFRTSKEATNALCLNMITFMGKRMHVERPKRWVGSACSHIVTWNDILSTFRMSSGAIGPTAGSCRKSSKPGVMETPIAGTKNKAIVIFDDEGLDEESQEETHIKEAYAGRKPETVSSSKNGESDGSRDEQSKKMARLEEQVQELNSKFEKEREEHKKQTAEIEKQHHESAESLRAECGATKKRLETLRVKNTLSERKFDEFIEQHSTAMTDLAKERRGRRKAEEAAESLKESNSELQSDLVSEIRKRILAEQEITKLKAQLEGFSNPLPGVRVKQEEQDDDS